MTKTMIRPVGIALMIILMVLSIPWHDSFYSFQSPVPGLPGWVFISLTCDVLIALISAVVWLSTQEESKS